MMEIRQQDALDILTTFINGNQNIDRGKKQNKSLQKSIT